MKWKKTTIRFAVIVGVLAIVAIAAVSQYLPEDTAISRTPDPILQDANKFYKLCDTIHCICESSTFNDYTTIPTRA